MEFRNGKGIRVLDMSRVLAGPLCGQLLADMGGDVIKIERPKKGDDSRAWGPPFLSDVNGDPTSESAFFLSCNRGKRSVTVDLSNPGGRDIIRKLASTCDVLLENYKVGTLDRYGLGYSDLASLNPGLIYCSITGFGQTGPYSSRPGYDTIIQAMGGLMSITGLPDGVQGAAPVRVGIPITDFMTGLYATIAVQQALLQRTMTGKGQYIDLSLLDVQVSALSAVAMNYLVSGKVPTRLGNRLPTVYPSDAFRCQDGYIMIIVGNDGQFKRLCEAIGLEGLQHDQRFQANAQRVKHADELRALIANVFLAKPALEWLDLLEKSQVPCAPINNIDEVFADPQIVARGMLSKLSHPLAGEIPVISNPIRFGGGAMQANRAPPLLGEHTDEVLREVLGMHQSEIQTLRGSGALG